MKFEPGLLATAIGTMPHTDPQQACSLVISRLGDIPAWPQLPKLSSLESMQAQFTLKLPGAVMEGDRIYIDLNQDIDEPLRKLLSDYEEKAIDSYAPGPNSAAGLHAFLAADVGTPRAVKGQITGPISCGLSITDQERRPIIYHDIIADALAKHLRLQAAWQEAKLKALCPRTIIFVDEPYLSTLGSPFVSLSREQVTGFIEEVLGGIEGIKGIHCCGNTDWSLLLETSIDVLSFDAYEYAQPLSLYPQEIKAFLDRGGIIAWGIVPNNEQNLARETPASLKDRLEETMALPSRKGIPFPQLVSQGMVTPSCGLASLSPEAAVRALEVTAELSQKMRQRYGS
ncbi:MAG: methionine synthase [Dehalococcoidia bacterium]